MENDTQSLPEAFGPRDSVNRLPKRSRKNVVSQEELEICWPFDGAYFVLRGSDLTLLWIWEVSIASIGFWYC